MASFPYISNTPASMNSWKIYQHNEMFKGFNVKGLTYVMDSTLKLHCDTYNKDSFKGNPGTSTNTWYDISGNGNDLKLNGNLVGIDYDGFIRVRDYAADYINWVAAAPAMLNGLNQFTLEVVVFIPEIATDLVTTPKQYRTGGLHIMQWGSSNVQNGSTNYIFTIRSQPSIVPTFGANYGSASSASGGSIFPDAAKGYMPVNPVLQLVTDVEYLNQHNYLASQLPKRGCYYHLVCVANASLGNRLSYMAHYINGRLAVKDRYQQNFVTFVTNPVAANTNVFGRWNYGGNTDEYSQVGSGIRMIRFYNTALTEEQILQNYRYEKTITITT